MDLIVRADPPTPASCTRATLVWYAIGAELGVLTVLGVGGMGIGAVVLTMMFDMEALWTPLAVGAAGAVGLSGASAWFLARVLAYVLARHEDVRVDTRTLALLLWVMNVIALAVVTSAFALDVLTDGRSQGVAWLLAAVLAFAWLCAAVEVLRYACRRAARCPTRAHAVGAGRRGPTGEE